MPRVRCNRCGGRELVLLGLVAPHPAPGTLRPCPGSLDNVGTCPVCREPVVVFLGAVLPHPAGGVECAGTARAPDRRPVR